MGNTCRGSFGVKDFQGEAQPVDPSVSRRNNTSQHSNSDCSPKSVKDSQKPNAEESAKENLKKDSNLPVVSSIAKEAMRRGIDYQAYFVLGHRTANIGDLYTLGRELGQGQFGTTYLCTENSTGVEYACKSISKRKLIYKEDVEDVRREIQIMHHLSGHKNMFQSTGAYEDPLYVHIVWSCVLGVSCLIGSFIEGITVRGRRLS